MIDEIRSGSYFRYINDRSLDKSKVGRLFVLFQPAEVLNISPEVDFAYSFVIDLMLLFALILEIIRPKNNSIAEFDYGFTGDKNGKGGIIGIVYSELVAVDL
jgi:hypothetical protein